MAGIDVLALGIGDQRVHLAPAFGVVFILKPHQMVNGTVEDQPRQCLDADGRIVGEATVELGNDGFLASSKETPRNVDIYFILGCI